MTVFQKEKKEKEKKEDYGFASVTNTKKRQFGMSFILTKKICYCASVVRTK